jgi:SNF2 family DNA or RNA helicase
MGKRFKRNYAYVEGDEIHVICQYSAGFVEDCRQIEGRKWNAVNKSNSFPMSSAAMVKALGAKYNIYLPIEVFEADVVSHFSESDKNYQVGVENDNVVICFDYNPQMIQAIRTFIPGVKWISVDKLWKTSDTNIAEALAFANQYGLSVSPELDKKAKKLARETRKRLKASSALDADIEIPGIAIPLLPYQKAGVAYINQVRKGIIGDQPGLGKTAQAMASVVLNNAFPVIVVCPNTLKLNWEREVKKFFPNLTTSILSGTKSVPIEESDVVIVNYDICAERIDDLFRHGFNSLVIDESHAIKNGKKSYRCPVCKVTVRANSKLCGSCKSAISAEEVWSVKRTGAVMRLAKSLPAQGLAILLTGTPITSRPEELIPQLEAIGVLDKFGGAWRFKNRYAPKRNVATNTKELNDKLREMCFVRRVKADVYKELPELRNAVQYLDIDVKDLSRYREVEADVIEYFARRAQELAEEEDSDGTEAYWQKKIRLERSENFVKIAALRNVVSEIKYDTVTKWLDNFIESSDGEKVIVFAEHIKFVEKLAERYADLAVKIRGGVTIEDRQAAVDRFQSDPTCRIFVANMTSASEGLTLTAASDVVFCELGWTPAIHEQCASRCYGRANDLHGATAWYLLAPGTIDENIYELLEYKKRIVDSVTDGVDIDGGNVMDGLIKDLVDRGRRHV